MCWGLLSQCFFWKIQKKKNKYALQLDDLHMNPVNHELKKQNEHLYTSDHENAVNMTNDEDIQHIWFTRIQELKYDIASKTNLPVQIQDFILGKQIIVSTFQKFLLNNSENPVCFETNPTSLRPFILSNENKTTSCITADKFFDLLVGRWEEEINYLEEIKSIKDIVYKYYDEFEIMLKDELMLNVLRNSKQNVINAIFDLCGIDQANVVGEFCSGLMNGFEADLQKNIHQIACLLFYQQYITPFPLGLFKLLENNFKKCKNSSINLAKAQKMTSEIESYVKNYLNPIHLMISQFESNEAFVKLLSSLTAERKQCIVIIDNLNNFIPGMWDNNIKCVKQIHLQSQSFSIGQHHFNYCCDSFEIVDPIKDSQLLIVLTKLTKNLTRLMLNLKNIANTRIGIVSASLMNLSLLRTLHLNFSYNNLNDDNVCSLSKSLNRLYSITNLQLNFYWNYIHDFGFLSLMEGITNMKFLLDLKLTFSENRISNIGLNTLAKVLVGYKKLTALTLDSISNQITSDGVIQIAHSLQNLTDLKTIVLYFCNNNVNDEGVEEIGKILPKFEFLNHVKLYFRSNRIRNDGFKALIKSLKKIKNPCNIDLNFSDTNVEDSSDILIEKFRKKKSHLCITFQWHYKIQLV